ncbi:type II toxin-antitoxin system VapC family toxin [Aminobacter carboxidus]|uniref:Ribonuclease VapC n=1 Tax=Aminobacter carboxidus TaxID=376165 RepID=A0A8E1WHQ3_9HYPH|nr:MULTISPECIES: type II toxin-antitoxin system VapC family toxin [Aminobacter carboxidus group]MBB6467666.1 ribonuclease VapC [Aminobacter lissarensis]MBE1205841.1 type II toxin-antitoxin system VapC family toxin [Aminobacter carboxidus]
MIVVDTSAIFAFLAAEPEAEALARRMQSEPVLVCAPTWAETGIVVSSRLGAEGLDRLQRLAQALQFDVVAFDRGLADAAVDAHRRFGRGSGHAANLNFGDCFAYALAKSRRLPLLFKGDDFIHTDIEPALKPA